MTGYVKLFGSILGSSVWAGPDSELRVWIAILALKGRDHVVRISVPGLATVARVSLEECRTALAKFKAPDLDSTSPEYEGRKIRDLPTGGWLVLNGAKYAKMLSLEDRREYQRIKQAEYRARKDLGSAGQRLEERAETPEQLLRAQELNGGLKPGFLGSHGPEAQEAVQRPAAARINAAVDDIPDPDSPGGFPEV